MKYAVPLAILLLFSSPVYAGERIALCIGVESLNNLAFQIGRILREADLNQLSVVFWVFRWWEESSVVFRM